MKKEKFEEAQIEAMPYQDPNATLDFNGFVLRVLDYVDQLGWQPYQVFVNTIPKHATGTNIWCN